MKPSYSISITSQFKFLWSPPGSSYPHGTPMTSSLLPINGGQIPDESLFWAGEYAFCCAVSTTSICCRGPQKIDRIPHGCFTGNPNPRPNKPRTSRFVAEVPPKIPIYRWLKSIKIPLKHYFLSMFDSEILLKSQFLMGFHGSIPLNPLFFTVKLIKPPFFLVKSH